MQGQFESHNRNIRNSNKYYRTGNLILLKPTTNIV